MAVTPIATTIASVHAAKNGTCGIRTVMTEKKLSADSALIGQCASIFCTGAAPCARCKKNSSGVRLTGYSTKKPAIAIGKYCAVSLITSTKPTMNITRKLSSNRVALCIVISIDGCGRINKCPVAIANRAAIKPSSAESGMNCAKYESAIKLMVAASAPNHGFEIRCETAYQLLIATITIAVPKNAYGKVCSTNPVP